MAEQAMNPYAQMLQMMGAGATTDQLTQQALLQRRLDLANALTQQGMQPLSGTEMAGQVAIRKSPLEGVAKIAQILGGNYEAKNLMQQQIQSRASMLGGMQAPGVAPAPQMPMPNGGTPVAQSGIANPALQQNPNGNAVVGAMAAAPQQSPVAPPVYDPFSGMTKEQRLAAYLTNPTDYTGKITEANKDYFDKLPESVRLAMFGNQNPTAAAAGALAKANSHVTIDGAGRQIDTNTGAVLGAAPSLAPGATYGEGLTATGLPTSTVPFDGGYDAIIKGNAAGKFGDYVGSGPVKTYDANGKATYASPTSVMPKPEILGGPSGSNGAVAEAPPGAIGRANMANTYEEGLQNRVNSGNQLMLRYQEMNNALNAIRTGGGSEARSNLAKIAQGFGAPTTLVDKINGGDLSATQEFQKLAAQSAMQNLRMSMDGKGAPAQSEFQTFEKNNPNIELDPRAISKIFAFTNKLHANDLAEYSGYLNWKGDGKNPADYPLHWSQQLTAKTNAPAATQAPDLMSAVQAEIARRKAANGR